MTYKVTIEVDQQWLDILGQISKHQDGFMDWGRQCGTGLSMIIYVLTVML